MSQRILCSPFARVFCALFVSLVLLWSSEAAAQSNPKEPEPIEALLKHAWTYYWVGIVELGDVRSFDRGLEFVEQAKARLKDHPDATQQDALERVESALNEQRGLAEITLRGNFPLTAFLGASIFIDATSLGTYEIIDEPYDAAVSQMAESLRDEILEHWSIPIQTDVLVISNPPNRTFENKVTFLIERSPKINVIPLGQVKERLGEADYEALAQGQPERLSQSLAKALDSQSVLLISVVEVDIVDDVYFYEFHASLWRPELQMSEGAKPYKSMVKRGLVRDRRERRWPFILVMGALLLFGVAMTGWLSRERAEVWEAALIGVMGYLVGVISPHIILKFLVAFEPHEEELVKLAIWWPGLTGLVILLGPAIMFVILTKRLGPSAPLIKRAYELGPQAAVSIGAGAAAFMARGAMVYDERFGLLLVLAVLPGAVGAARHITALRAGQLRSAAHGTISGLGVVALPFAFFSWSLPLTALASALALSGVWSLGQRVQETTHSHEDDEAEEGFGEEALEQLIVRARRPPYRAYAPYQQAFAQVESAKEGGKRLKQSCWVVLQGQKGSGKTATSTALVDALREGAVLLHGVCPPPSNEDLEGDGDGHEAKPFEVFAQAFGDASAFGLEDVESDVFSELEGSVLDALPIVSMLLPAGEDAGRTVSDRGEIYTRIERELIRKTKKGTRQVILWLDDIQWLDNASQGLLAHLLERFAPGSPHPILFLLCGRALPVRSPLSERHQRALRELMIKVELDEPQRLKLLKESIGFDERSARLLDGAVTDSEGKSNLAWLLTLVEAVAREGKVRQVEGVYQLTVEDSESLPIPDNFKKMVGATYEKLAREERELMRAATCMGSAFSIEVLSRVTSLSRLSVLDVLEQISHKTHLVEDNLAVDDLYQFVSAQRYVALRDHLRLQDMHPKVQAPQILRDLHFQVAQILEHLWSEQQANVADVAHHYYNAGRRDLRNALKFCRLAAKHALDVFAYDNAEFQLKRALVCAEMLSKSISHEASRQEALGELAALELELKMLPFDKAHVLGLGELSMQNAEVAQETFTRWQEQGGLEALQHAPPLPLLIRMARACYDARSFDLAIQIARALEALGLLPDEPQDEPDALVLRAMARAEGLHFIGLSLSPRDEAPQRLEYLEQTVQVVEALELRVMAWAEQGALQDSAKSLEEIAALKGRVYNSLAEQLSQRATYDFMSARQWFHRSIDLKRSLKPEDKPGLARAYGGLGRLHLFYADAQEGSSAKDYVERAQGYFEQDLAMCQDYGDVAGECQMQSHLGDCALRQGRVADAVEHYVASVRLAATPINKAFALIGLLKAQLKSDDLDGRAGVVAQIVTHYEQKGFPGFLERELYGVLQSCHVDTSEVEGLDKVLLELGQRLAPAPAPTPAPTPEPTPEPPASDSTPATSEDLGEADDVVDSADHGEEE